MKLLLTNLLGLFAAFHCVAFPTVENTNVQDSIPLVFVSGTEGYACYRTPSMVVTQQGTVLTFCGGRVNNCDDEGDIDIVLKRSTDGGKTWGPIMVLENDGPNPCKNPCPVVLPSGRILLMWLWNESIPSEEYRTTREVYVTHSDDDGLTWAASRNVTEQVYRSNWKWYGIGPCHALIKELEPHKGRVIVPARHSPNMTSHIIYSDDLGETWHIGAIGLRTQTSECTAVELSNGDIMLNSRNGIKEEFARVVHISSDGGETFDTIYLDPLLVDAGACQGSILNHSLNDSTARSNIIFSNPDDLIDRVNGSLKLSMDDGKTWTKKVRYSNPYPAFSGYSDIALINGTDIAVLFEAGPSYVKEFRYEGIGFKTVAFDDINEPLTDREDYEGWVVYDGSVLLESASPPWAKDRVTEGITDVQHSVLSSVVADPDIEGNNLLKMEDLIGDRRESWRLNWQIRDPERGLTVVLRTKPTEGILESAPSNGFDENKFLYISPRNGAFHDALSYWHPDDISFSQSGFSTKSTVTDWMIYRLTLKGDDLRLYLNEDPSPVISGKTPKSTTANELLLGDNTPEPYGSYFDWIIWDLSGSYAPGQGRLIPDSLYTGLGTSVFHREPEWYSGSLSKLELYPNPADETVFIKAQPGAEVHIFSLSGVLVSEFQMKGEMENLHLSHYVPGMYVVRIEWNGEIFRGKLIKK